MNEIVTFFDNLEAHLASASDRLEEIEAKHILQVSGDDPDQPKTVDAHVQLHVMKAKGIGIVIYGGDEGENLNADSTEDQLNVNIPFEVRLYIHPKKWGRKYDPSKRKARIILQGLLKSLHGANIEPFTQTCYERVVVEDFAPIGDKQFWVWNITAKRSLYLT